MPDPHSLKSIHACVRQSPVLVTLLVASVINWLLFFGVSMYLHGDALGTLPSKEGFVVRSHGQLTPVSESVWLFSLFYSGATLMLTPAIWIAAAVRAFSVEWRHARLLARFGIPILVVAWCLAWYLSLGGSFRSSAQDWLALETASRTGIAGRLPGPSGDRNVDFVRAVLGDSEGLWDELFRARGGRSYPKPKAVLVSGLAVSACGTMDVSSGPRYCAVDSRIYVDSASLGEFARRSGDFAAAYLLVHEVGRHVQNVLGAERPLDASKKESTAVQDVPMRTRPEFEADCYVGVWTHSVQKRGLVEAREVESGMSAALTIGSVPGAEDAAERRRWFEHGLLAGDPRTCDR
jgi:predicted metalloprotease